MASESPAISKGPKFFRNALRVTAAVFLVVVPLTHGAPPERGTATEKNLDSLKLRLEKGPNKDQVASHLARSKDPIYVPLLAEAFGKSTNDEEKFRFAYAVVMLGEKDTTFANFMQRRVTEILKIDIPYPRIIGADNRLAGYTKEFLVWCRQRNRDTAQAEMDATFRYPKDFMQFAWTADPRNGDILLQGLHARNTLIAIMSAQGLVRLGSDRFEKPIIEAIKSRTPREREGMAKVLVYFDSPEARRMAETYLQPKEYLDALRKRREKTGYKGVFGN